MNGVERAKGHSAYGWLVALAVVSCRPGEAHDAGVRRDGASSVVLGSRDRGGVTIPDRPVTFSPVWHCRVTGLGRVAHPLHVNVPPPPRNRDPGAIDDVVPIATGGTLARESITGDGGVRAGIARVVVRDANGAVQASREVPVVPRALELLFERGGSVGLAFWDGQRVVGQPLDGSAAIVVADTPREITRPCTLPISDALRLYPLARRALPFPPIAGIPPATADARWTLALDGQGLCVVRLEGEGPWGRVLVEAAPEGMRGELTLSEGVYPVACAPGPPERDGGR